MQGSTQKSPLPGLEWPMQHAYARKTQKSPPPGLIADAAHLQAQPTQTAVGQTKEK